jgi:hypothetical protein
LSAAPRIRPGQATRPTIRIDRRRSGRPDEGAVLSLLSEILIGDTAWTLAEVQRLVTVRDLAELGRWRSGHLDDEGPSAR